MEHCRIKEIVLKIERQRIFNAKFLYMKVALVIFLKTCLGLDSYKSALNHAWKLYLQHHEMIE
jgi:hypothetical protein